ncbi:hypothetical protein BS636_04825 [Acinetobacter sp. LoGeW2-3]|uniref:DUF6714 family protein n=1 Tax=Acinetobacter sp. LoGeW2-3 TaxID=1808001 RepID=UPI000C05B212|nr:DUF6714 family protein [Acinetobacter sp. LoGeW2-3]ATO19032.1 hypothetical protein BS636_04825 [Acinetobacter sp. LoGeW2-3]
MKIYPSPEDIQQMKQLGYDLATIANAEETLCLWQAVKDIQTQIETAFSNVSLGDGIGLWEAQGVDDYKSLAERAALREKDEKSDWSKIPVQDLNDCNSSLGFFDAQGMRFHLPTFLITDLQGKYRFNLAGRLCKMSDELQQFHLFDKAQREAVQAYLNWIFL